MKIVLASHNQKKIAEFQQFMGTKFNVLSLTDVGITDEVEETGRTYKQNAMLKAAHASALLPDTIVVADDSGIEFACMNNLPGIYSHRFMQNLTDDQRNETIVNFAIARDLFGAYYFNCLVVMKDNIELQTIETSVPGSVSQELRGDRHFAYDRIFKTETSNGLTWDELELSEKNEISHRGLGAKKLADFLNELEVPETNAEEIIDKLRKRLIKKPFNFCLSFGYYGENIYLEYVNENELRVHKSVQWSDEYFDGTQEFDEVIKYAQFVEYLENRLSEETTAYIETPTVKREIEMRKLLGEVMNEIQRETSEAKDNAYKAAYFERLENAKKAMNNVKIEDGDEWYIEYLNKSDVFDNHEDIDMSLEINEAAKKCVKDWCELKLEVNDDNDTVKSLINAMVLKNETM